MRLLFYLICVVIYILSYFFDVTEFGITNFSPAYTMFTYMFVHTNIIHLIANIVCIEAMHIASENEYWSIFKFRSANVMFITFYFFAAVGGLIASQYKVTIGASGIAYAYLGFILSYTFNINKKFFRDTLIFVALVNLVSYLVGNNNFLVHLLPLSMGFIYHRVAKYVRGRDNKYNSRE